MIFPRLYAIVDAGVLAARGVAVEVMAEGLRDAGVDLLQYRDKAAGPRRVLETAAAIRGAFRETACRLILNDRADLCVLAGWDGVHVGQGDLSVADARRVVGPGGWVGVSTHTGEEVVAADAASSPDYIAVGPVFATGTKLDAEASVGLDGVRRARALTGKPLVAIGGITRANARSVLEAGADSVAVISGLLVEGETVEKVARDFLELLR